MKKIYAKIIDIPKDTDDNFLKILKSYADIFYTSYDLLEENDMKKITKIISESLRSLLGLDMKMCFAQDNVTDEYLLCIFDIKPDGCYGTPKVDTKGVYAEVNE